MTEEEWKSLHKSKRWRLRNPGKQAESTRKWVERNQEYVKERARFYSLRGQYGITEEIYQEMLKSQNYKCAICETDTPTGKWKVFAVDHNHETGKVRGLLCNECNRGMGLLKDNSEFLRKAADYLDKTN